MSQREADYESDAFVHLATDEKAVNKKVYLSYTVERLPYKQVVRGSNPI